MMFASLTLLLTPAALPAQEPERDPVGPVTIYRFDTVETLEGESLENVSLLVRDGIIERMGPAVIIPDHATVHDYRGSGRVLTPPLVLSHANFLITDRRGGGNNSRFRAVDSMWLTEDWEQWLHEEGIYLLGVDPPGSGIPGRTSVLKADGQVGPPDSLVADLHLKLELQTGSSGKRLVRGALDAADKAIENEDKARADWKKAREAWEEEQKKKEEEAAKQEGQEGQDASAQGGEGSGEGESKEPPKEFEPPKMDGNVEPLVEWVRKERMAQVWLRSASDWLHWQDVLGERELSYSLVLTHGSTHNFHEVVGPIAGTGLRVEVPAAIGFLPYTRTRVNLAAELVEAGVEKLVLNPAGSSWNSVRDWRLGVNQLVAEGLDRTVALKAITTEPAAAFGQEEVVGPIAVGGPATFVIWSGDPLDPLSQADFLVADGEVLYDREKAEMEAER